MSRNLIIGLDAGANFGVAILDTKGQPLDVKTIRQPTRGEVVRHILRFGNPVIISSDVNPLPRSIEKIANSVGSRTYFPPKALTIREKRKMIDSFEKDFPDMLTDIHQKDATAAALKAFRVYHGLFVRLEETLEKEGGKGKLDELISALLVRKGKNIAESVKRIVREGG